MEAKRTKILKTNEKVYFGYSITGTPEEIIKLINNENFIPHFDEKGNPLIWRRYLVDPAVIEISVKGRIALWGNKIDYENFRDYDI